jgi:hypothetical protein
MAVGAGMAPFTLLQKGEKSLVATLVGVPWSRAMRQAVEEGRWGGFCHFFLPSILFLRETLTIPQSPAPKASPHTPRVAGVFPSSSLCTTSA